jgi:hypothetical protein
LYGSKPAVHNLRVFVCKDFAHIPKANMKKLDAKAIKCIFIGYCSEFKAYKLFDPSTDKVFASRDVIFHEQAEGNNETTIMRDGMYFLKMKRSKKKMSSNNSMTNDLVTWIHPLIKQRSSDTN